MNGIKLKRVAIKGVVHVNKNLNIDVQTKTSKLENDSNFDSTNDISTKTSQLENDSKFVTEDEITAK